jgi:hypothetical protein
MEPTQHAPVPYAPSSAPAEAAPVPEAPQAPPPAPVEHVAPPLPQTPGVYTPQVPEGYIQSALAYGTALPPQQYVPQAPPVAAQPSNPAYASRLQSEKVVVSAPLSYAGSAARIWKLTQVDSPGAKAGLACLAVVLIAFAWAFVTCWYLFFGLWLVPYRLIRRGSRQRKRQALQHREMMAALQQQHQQPPYYG